MDSKMTSKRTSKIVSKRTSKGASKLTLLGYRDLIALVGKVAFSVVKTLLLAFQSFRRGNKNIPLKGPQKWPQNELPKWPQKGLQKWPQNSCVLEYSEINKNRGEIRENWASKWTLSGSRDLIALVGLWVTLFGPFLGPFWCPFWDPFWTLIGSLFGPFLGFGGPCWRLFCCKYVFAEQYRLKDVCISHFLIVIREQKAESREQRAESRE